ncbi:spermidine/putrescine ABC transporter substrate-binding protein [Actinocorallia sp. A-T 12471]|uniref:polyamine ABC transporter substrate-binding protein n=1 Tax=Actinocorallia sp. A-T 12471 TaxID=3089813 RepID=UPI0029D2D791|nr:spermidine/putrescine ABC transporter substrate-binding protein [Actinocorallia sp. A-T 12471]MDX6743281.1 spermidine/putrescine ABC transporter substrate-binding protein [Actinocorallia sp. A-T 12471]
MNEINPLLRRGLTHRRDFLRLMGVGAVGLAAAACGVEGQGGKQNVTQSEVEKYWAGKTKNGKLNWANWVGYMEDDRATLKAFTKATGIEVTYKEVINENAEWFGKIDAPLRAGQSIGFDLMVMSNGIQLEQARQLGYLVPLDHAKLPNFAANAGESFKNPPFDPDNTFTVPYTSGITGIAYNTKYVKEPITKWADLLDPKYKGKIGMMGDSQELGNVGMFLVGVDPERSTPEDWEKAAAKLREQRPLVRKYYTQDYIEAVTKGDVWITMAWSGDAYSLAGPEVEFVIPEEGGTIWTDNLCIPSTAENPVDALELMNWLYDPRANATLTEYINYITPVPATKDFIRQDAEAASGDEKKALEDLISSPLVFPTEADLAKLRRYRTLTQDEKEKYQSVFTPIPQGS